MLFWQRGLPSQCSERAEVLRCLPQGFHEWRLVVNDEGINAKDCAGVTFTARRWLGSTRRYKERKY